MESLPHEQSFRLYRHQLLQPSECLREGGRAGTTIPTWRMGDRRSRAWRSQKPPDSPQAFLVSYEGTILRVKKGVLVSPHEQARMHWGLRGSAPPGRGSPPGSLHPCWHAECLKCFCSWLMCSSLAETSALPTLCSELRRVCCSRILIDPASCQGLPLAKLSWKPTVTDTQKTTCRAIPWCRIEAGR